MAIFKLSFTFYHALALNLAKILLNPDIGFCTDFNRNFTGVTFSPYVKYRENGVFPDKTQLSLDSIKAMITVVSTKFSRILTNGAVAEAVPYRWNITYHNSKRDIYSAEAAALVNREQNEKLITIIIGIWLYENLQQMITEVRLALEAAEKSNKIYSGTSQGLVFFGNNIFSKIYEAQQTLQSIRTFRKEADQLGLKIGIRYRTCNSLLTNIRDESLNTIKIKILRESDFLICESIPSNYDLGPVDSFNKIKKDFLTVREVFNVNYSHLEIMGQTQWPSSGSNRWHSIENQETYWKLVDSFAVEHNFSMWLVEAFDNPWKTWDAGGAHLGWWKLNSNLEAHLQQGYIEKVSGDKLAAIPTTEQSSSTTVEIEVAPNKTDIDSKQQLISDQHQSKTHLWVYIWSGVALGIILLLVAIITFLCFRVKRLKEVLTKADIEEFLVGTCCNKLKSKKEKKNLAVETAAQCPYDKSYEFSKEQLKIQEELLGTGQFGCVFKATLLKDNDDIQVALKMAKKDCPRSALMGLLSEIKILIYLGKHQNIVSIKGAYTAELLNGVVYIATELCSMGSLESYLRKNQRNKTSLNQSKATQNVYSSDVSETIFHGTPPNEITLSEMIRWSHEIACGMEYLGDKHVIHADLATRNVLLTSDKTAKLTDFGLSRRMYNYTNYVKKHQEPLPWRWMSIEALKRLDFSSMSDVWSYGVTIWEIFSGGDIPYPYLSWDLEFVEKLTNGMRMKCPPHTPNDIYKIMLNCWEAEPNSRPSFSDLKSSWTNLKDELDENYTQLFE